MNTRFLVRTARLRPTAISRAILHAMQSLSDPFTADDMYQQLLVQGAECSLGSVYRVLNALASAGQISRRWEVGTFSSRVVYFARPDADRGDQVEHRFSCKTCGHAMPLGGIEFAGQLATFLGCDTQDEQARGLVVETDRCANCAPRPANSRTRQ